MQLGQLRDAERDLKATNTLLLAISTSPRGEAAEAAEGARLGFPIGSDPECLVIDAYGLRHFDEEMDKTVARPSVFILDADGIVRFAHVGEHPRDRPAVGVILLALASIGKVAKAR